MDVLFIFKLEKYDKGNDAKNGTKVQSFITIFQRLRRKLQGVAVGLFIVFIRG